jgi:signal transduction histidine kinase/Tfp pilus assembly protein PilF
VPKVSAFIVGMLWCAVAAQAAPRVEQARFDSLVAEAKTLMMSDPRRALGVADQAISAAQTQLKPPDRQEAVATGLWLKAEALLRVNEVAQAKTVANNALSLTSGAETLLKGNLDLTLGRIADSSGDVALALRSYQGAYNIFVALHFRRGQALSLQGLGMIYDEAHDFKREISYYRQAMQVYSQEPALQLSAANNVGFALLQNGNYDQAIEDFQHALSIATSLKSTFLQARILTNLASVYSKQHKFDLADKTADRAMRLLKQSDEAGWAPFVWGVKAEIELGRGNIGRASYDLEQTFHGTNLQTTIAPYRDFHEIAYKVYSESKNYPLALAHLEAFKRLDDQGRSLVASANLALLGAQFDFANQRLEIERLKGEQLKREMALRESRSTLWSMIFFSLLLGIAGFLGWTIWRNRLLHKHRDAMQHANTELTKSLDERDLEITRRIETEARLLVAKDDAERANHAKTNFLANMSHELRTPLNAIIGFSEILKIAGLQDKFREYANDINSSGKALLDHLNKILDMARLDSGAVTLYQENSSISEVVNAAVDRVKAQTDLEARTIRITVAKHLRLHADSDRLRQIVEHVLSNAIKFTGPDGNIQIKTLPYPDGGLELRIEDDGIGISPEQLPIITEPFNQVESVHTRLQGGVGLGIPIAKSLVELHGGSLTIKSKPGQGTHVLIYFPPAVIVPHVGLTPRLLSA